MKYNLRQIITFSLLTALLITSFCPRILCQESFTPISAAQASQYHIDFARRFFASPEAEKAQRSELENLLGKLETLKNKTGSSAENLLQALELNDEIKVELHRHTIYLYLRYETNITDEASEEGESKLNAEVADRTAFLNRELLQIDDGKLQLYAQRKPSLRNYLFAIEEIRRYRPYTASPAEEKLLKDLEPLGSEWQSDLYRKLVTKTRSAASSAGNAAPNSGKTPASGDSERAGREEKFKSHYAALSAQRDLFAFTLLRLAKAKNQLAEVYHFENAPGQAYFDRYWSESDVKSLLQQIADQSGIYRRYEQIQVDYVKKIVGYSEVNLWDLPLAAKGIKTPPRFTIDEASETIKNALAPLGPEYSRELGKLLDPANGRMDIVSGKNRDSGGFSEGYTGIDSVFFAGGFQGSYSDMRLLAHESTHAVHRQLMNENHVLPVYVRGPHYLFEAFAILNEFLLPDYLYNHTTDPALKQYYLKQFLDGKGMEMFVVAPEAVLEQAVYEGAAKDNLKGADDLDLLTKKVYSQFSTFQEKHDMLKNRWMDIRLMFQDPFYDINYVYGALLALKFYEMYTKDPQHFVPRYIALMKNGFNNRPEVLLKKFLDIDLHAPNLLRGATKIINEKLDLLEKSYQN